MRLEGARCFVHSGAHFAGLPAAAVSLSIPSNELAAPAGRYGL
jgi:hypothetical protein